MTFYDIIMLVLLLGAVLFGYWKGLAWQIASVAAVVVSYFAAYRFRDQVAQFVQAEPPFNQIAAMLIIFVACSLIIWMAYAYVNRSLEKAELDGFNRQMGALVGALLGVLLCMVVTMFSVSLLGKAAHDSIFASKFGPYVVRGISMVQSIVPEELAASLDPHFEKFYQQTEFDPNRPINSYPAYQNSNANATAVPGGSQYSTGDLFTPNSGQQSSYQGNWNTTGQGQGGYANGYQQPSSTQTQTGFGYQPSATNQGTNYVPPTSQQFVPQTPQQFAPQTSQQFAPQTPQQFAPTQPTQGSGLPPINLKLDTETLLNGAGQLLRDRFTNPN